MEILFASRLLGWASVLLLGLVIGLPYSRLLGSGEDRHLGSGSPWRRMTLHFWLPSLVATGSFVHALLPMVLHRLPHTNYTGMRLATVALALIIVQIGFGVWLRFGSQGRANILRRIHLGVMMGIVALVLAHLWLNNLILR